MINLIKIHYNNHYFLYIIIYVVRSIYKFVIRIPTPKEHKGGSFDK